MTELPVDPRELRVSDAERSHVVNLLQKAIGQGLLSLDEFTERTDRALAAKTRGELNAVLVDLPGLTHTDPTSPVKTPPVELRANMSTIKRSGAWDVPRELIIRNRLGSTKLDFSEARIEHAEVRIKLDVSGGTVKLQLPERAMVDTNGVQVIAGTVKDRVGGASGRPRFVITGRITAGTLKIRRSGYVRIGNVVIRSPWKMGVATD
ncbi:DUF1707 domain-containing protein [Actinophytocola sp.]|uniref:DUF1707 SHOCT-like domain-containing protein n=1 Tax=Actinophytocola sp. TaxID=1872138 RepID=UPI00389AD1C7